MSTRKALFVNFSNEAFTGYWNSEPYKFGPSGSKNDRMYMEEWKARHFAKHLVNRELLKVGEETHTSPKFPEQDKIFMDMFEKAVIIEDDEAVSEEQASTDLINLNQESSSPRETKEEVKEFEDLDETA